MKLFSDYARAEFKNLAVLANTQKPLIKPVLAIFYNIC